MKIEAEILEEGMSLDEGTFNTWDDFRVWLSDSGLKGRDIVIKIDEIPFIDTTKIRSPVYEK